MKALRILCRVGLAAGLAACSSAHTAGSGGSAIPPADVLAVQMFNSSNGVAVAFQPSQPACERNCIAGAPARHHDVLAVTSDSGTTWRVAGAFPTSFDPAQSYEVQLAFHSADEGYVESTSPASTLFTDDAGRKWSSLNPPGQPTAISLYGSVLWIVSNFCPTPTTPAGLCPSRLLSYPLGHLTPASDLPIPTVGIAASQGISTNTRAATLLDRLGSNSAVVEEGGEGAPSSLLFTGDSGQHWTILDDPCEGLIPTGLVAPAPTTWVLYCQLDSGMNQGATRLYTTSDQGSRWTLTAEGNVEGPMLGSIGDGMAGDLTLSGNRHVLWLLGSVGGISSSTDGGFDWTRAPVQTGGYDTELAAAGPTDAWLPLPGITLEHTTDGTTWRRLS